MDTASFIGHGFAVALSLHNLGYCFVGVLIGTLVGVIPGIGAISAISMLLPITYHMDPVTALIMLGGIWYGAAYGGSTASILLNIPGTPSTAVTCLEGYPMARQGRAGIALLMVTVASFIGGSMGTILLSMFAPIIADYALSFGSAEYFALMVFGLVAASTISNGSTLKGLAAVVMGVMLGCVGTDLSTGVARFTFGVIELSGSIGIIPVAMGIFGIAEVIASIGNVAAGAIDPASTRLRAMVPTREDLRRSGWPIIRGSSIGSMFGTLPGVGPAIAAFAAYGVEKRVSRRPERFGKGAIEGLVSPEAANNAADMTAFIPTLSLGIPGSPTMALMLGVLIIHGIAPGPNLLTSEPDLFWGLIVSFWIGNILLVILNAPLVGLWVKLLTVPYHILFPIVIVFICIGTFSVQNSAFDVWLVVALGAFGYAMRIFGWPAAPMLLGLVLGPPIEEHFRRATLLSGGDVFVFIERPISAILILVTVAMLAWAAWSTLIRARRMRIAASE